MSTNTESHTRVRESVAQASETVGSNWPIHSFVTANPLAGFEDRPFHEAVERANALRGGSGYPDAETFRRAWEAGRIDPGELRDALASLGYDPNADPEALLDRLADDGGDADDAAGAETPTDRVDRVLCKWLAAFLDEGEASWPMPNRADGFYDAFRAVARHDSSVPDADSLADAPDDPTAVIADALADYPAERWTGICEAHLHALPGWTGLIERRAAGEDDWQDAHPVTLTEYLAVRLLLAERFGAPVDPGVPDDPAGDAPVAEAWLCAWEATYRGELVDAVADESAAHAGANGSVSEEAADADTGGDGADARPDAQLVFCIDTRSEVFRRHLEAAGDYETYGYAGFFGVPMRYEGYHDGTGAAACPPIVEPEHHVRDVPDDAHAAEREAHDRWHHRLHTGETVLKSVKSNAATAFSFVESAGSAYGVALAARTLLPGGVRDAVDALTARVPSVTDFVSPTVEATDERADGLPVGMTLEERVAYADAAFDTMGWESFSRLVVFTGHASETANNPFDASLDCGACAGNPGGPNARTLAAICNDDDVLHVLRSRGHEIPKDTVFLAAEHNTTTDEVELYDGDVPESHAADLERLRGALADARAGATEERVASMGVETDDPVREVETRAGDWAQTRPEWGLAGNASLVVGPRGVTENLDLDGRAFLHSYDWRTDEGGDALDAIFDGPAVVTQWINAQYYFSTVDNAAYGSGSKITQNPVGNVGVYQGNGGDLMTGLPLQSLMAADDVPYHQPLRLSIVVHAPVERVRDVLADHDAFVRLLDNGWLSLAVVDPTRGHDAAEYVADEGFAFDEDADEASPPADRTGVEPVPADD